MKGCNMIHVKKLIALTGEKDIRAMRFNTNWIYRSKYQYTLPRHDFFISTNNKNTLPLTAKFSDDIRRIG